MVRVNGTTITMTRGDTLTVQIAINKADGTPYEPEQGDAVRFALKKDYSDKAPLIMKTIDIEDLCLTLVPNDTKKLAFGDYVYDIELTQEDGTVDTFVAKARFKITEEVY